MARLPVPGGDSGDWGDILNAFLDVSHNPDGTLASNTVGTNQLQSGSVTSAQLDSPTQAAIAAVASKYVKPTDGIPVSDLSSPVQAGLSAATTAVQSVNGKTGTSITLAASDVSALPATTKLAGLADTAAASGATNNQVLSFNSTTEQWVPATVTSTTVNDAATSSKGIIELAGDLGGTAASPTVPTKVSKSGDTMTGDLILPGTPSEDLAAAPKQYVDAETTRAEAAEALLIPLSQKGATSGVASLDSTGKVPSAQLPAASASTLAGDTDVSISSPSNNQVLTYDATSSKWQNQTAPTPSNATSSAPGLIQLDGDLGGTATSPTVAGINGIALPSSAPSSSGQVLTATSSSATAWQTPAAGVSLDTTASDIQPLGTQGAGSTGKAADAGHVHAMPRLDQVSAPTSAVALNSQKITGLANGTASTDAAALGQIPVAGTTAGTYAAGNDSRFAGSALGSTSLQQLPIQSITATAGALVPGAHNPVNATSGSLTMTLPTGQAFGTLLGVEKTDSSSNSVAITGNIRDTAAQTLSLSLLHEEVLFEADSSGSWWPIAGHKTLSSLDGRYINQSTLGAASGVATLNGSSQLTTSQLPSSVESAIQPFALGQRPISSTSYIDLCTAWSNGSSTITGVTAAAALTVTFNSTATAMVTSGTAPASGAIISDALPPNTTFTANGNTLTLSNAATLSASKPAWAGVDCTSALQAALNYANAENISMTVEFSVPGIYLLNGALQTGVAQGYTYKGQVLVPPRANLLNGTTSIDIRIKGAEPTSGLGGGQTSGVILLGNQGSGNIFDTEPAFTQNSFVGTSIVMTFEDITVRAPTSPSGNGINGTGFLGLRIAGSCAVDTIAGTFPTNGNGTDGTKIAVLWPALDNFGQLHQTGELFIGGWPYAMNTGEHLTTEMILIANCITGIYAVTAAHPVVLGKVCMQNVTWGIQPAAQYAHVKGIIDVGDSGLGCLFNDPSSYLYGDIELAPVSYAHNGIDPEIPGLGVASNGGVNVSVKPFTRFPLEWPSDTFERAGTSAQATTFTYGPGVTDRTNHVWTPGNSIYLPTSGGMQSVSSSGGSSWFIKYNVGRNNPSRVVRLVVTIGSNCNSYIALGKVISGSSIGDYATVAFYSSGVLSIQKVLGSSFYTLATVGSIFTVGSTYTIDAVISNPYTAGGGFTITAYVNGVSELSHTMSSGDTNGNSITQLADTEQFFTQDGMGNYEDTTSTITEFSVFSSL